MLSPLLANLYLHSVLDSWFEREVRPRLRGGCRLVRYGDDAVMLFETDRDGQRVLAVLGKRLGRYGLTLHPDKTRYLDFRPKLAKRPGAGATFDFLGFTRDVWNILRVPSESGLSVKEIPLEQPLGIHAEKNKAHRCPHEI